MEQTYRFFENRKCEYYPCHNGVEELNCMFCYCPLYALGDRCGGDFTYTENGIKDCTNCLRPHRRENYPYIQKQLAQVMELAMRREKSANQVENP